MRQLLTKLNTVVGWWKYPVAATSLSTLLLLSRARISETPELNITAKSETIKTQSHSTTLRNQLNTMDDKFELRKQEAFWGLFIADALAMPVHWYYNPDDIYRGYGGWLTGYNAPNKKHPSSILSLSSVNGSGRTGWAKKSTPVVGSVILHDKLKYWKSGDRSIHYHQGMAAGDNTLNALTALQTMKTMQTFDSDAMLDPRDLRAHVMENYVKFLTTPGSHNDTYAESFHRSFFKDWSDLENPPRTGSDILTFCEKRWNAAEHGSEDGQLAVVGSLVLAIPWIVHYAHLNEGDCAERTVEAIKLTHPAPSLLPYIKLYANALHGVINGHDLYQVALESSAAKSIGGTRKQEQILKYIQKAEGFAKDTDSKLEVFQDAVSSLGSACYIQGALSSMLLLSIGFHNDFTRGVLTNANCGGENAHRGAALGALLGANSVNTGSTALQTWKDGLNSNKPDIEEIMKHRL